MANANAPFGARAVSGVCGQPYSGAIQQFTVAAGDGTALFIGDFVKLAGTSQIVNGQVFADVTRAATGDVIVGSVDSVLADTRDSPIYRAASTLRIVNVAVDPNALFEIQQVNSGTALTANDVGLNVDFVVAAGSTYTGMSGTTLNNATEAATNTLDLKIVGMVNRVDNDVGADVSTGAAASRFYVRINRHQYVNQVAGV